MILLNFSFVSPGARVCMYVSGIGVNCQLRMHNTVTATAPAWKKIERKRNAVLMCTATVEWMTYQVEQDDQGG